MEPTKMGERLDELERTVGDLREGLLSARRGERRLRTAILLLSAPLLLAATVTIKNSDFLVEGNTQLGDAATDTVTVKGPATFEKQVEVGFGSAVDDDFVYFDAAGQGKYLAWDDVPGEFVFSDDLRVAGNLTVSGSGPYVLKAGDSMSGALTIDDVAGLPLRVTTQLATTNSVEEALQLRRTTTGVAADGIGVRLGFHGEDSGGGVGSIAFIDALLTDADGGTGTDGALAFSVRDNGFAPAEKMRLTDNGDLLLGTSTAGIVAGSAQYLTVYAGNRQLSLELEGGSSAASAVQSKIDFISRTTAATDVNTARIEVRNTSVSTARGDLLFYTNGDGANVTERMRIRDNGWVGIGATPSDPLHLAGSVDNNGTNAMFRIASGAQTLLMDGNEIDALADGLFVNNNTTQDMCLVNGGGGVGIGRWPPVARLDVNGGAHFGTATGISASTGRVTISGGSGELDFQDRASAAWSSSDRWVIYNSADILRFYRNGDLVFIQADGTVSIGTSADSTKLLRVGSTTGSGLQLGTFESIVDGGANTIEVNTNFRPDNHKGWDLGTSTTNAWDDVYYDDLFNQGAPCWSDVSVLDVMRRHAPGPKPVGSFDWYKEAERRRELDPASLPRMLTEYDQRAYDYENGETDRHPDDVPAQELGIWTNGMVSWNYQAIHELIGELDRLRAAVERLEAELAGRRPEPSSTE